MELKTFTHYFPTDELRDRTMEKVTKFSQNENEAYVTLREDAPSLTYLIPTHHVNSLIQEMSDFHRISPNSLPPFPTIPTHRSSKKTENNSESIQNNSQIIQIILRVFKIIPKIIQRVMKKSYLRKSRNLWMINISILKHGQLKDLI